MSQIAKLMAAIRANPKNVRFDEACKVAERMGFDCLGNTGSHRTFARAGEPSQLNFQKGKNGSAKPYQVRQLIEMMDKYEGDV